MTYTYAELKVTRSTYEEIAWKLRVAGYEDAMQVGGAIDMRGIALICDAERSIDLDRRA